VVRYGTRVVTALSLLAVALLCACAPAAPGRAFNWNQAAATSPAAPPAQIAVAAAPTPVASGPSLSWDTVWNNLNQNTAEVAAGQYALLHEFEGALTSQIDGLLTRTK
jgi:hypothetical protein